MSFIQGTQLRKMLLGNGVVSKATGTLSGTTFNLFTIAGGEVLITALWGKVTTSITTDGGTLALNNAPTSGSTGTFVQATDLGTTDTTAGSVLGVEAVTAAAWKFLVGGPALANVVVTTGQVAALGASSVNGAATFYCTWIPLTDGATLVAS